MTRSGSTRPLLVGLIAAALLLGAGLVATSIVAARALRERNETVRDGILVRHALELEALLRERGPEECQSIVDGFVRSHADSVAGVDVAVESTTIASSGRIGSAAATIDVALGREWREIAWSVMDHGRGEMGGRPPFRVRLEPAPGLGGSGIVGWTLVAGSSVSALALAALAILGAVGLEKRRRLELVEADRRRLESIALAGAGLAHQIRNPLAAIKGTAQLVAESSAPPRERAMRIVEASERIEETISRLLDFARPMSPQAESVDLVEVVRAVVSRGPASAELRDLAPANAWADRGHVESILEELLANARTACPEGPLEVASGRDGGSTWIEVRDRGNGLDLDVSKAFEPYVTTRPDGTGLGLSIVRSLAEANGGAVNLERREGGGTIARLVLPAIERR
jgi:signal transduction histidine kinase